MRQQSNNNFIVYSYRQPIMQTRASKIKVKEVVATPVEAVEPVEPIAAEIVVLAKKRVSKKSKAAPVEPVAEPEPEPAPAVLDIDEQKQAITARREQIRNAASRYYKRNVATISTQRKTAYAAKVAADRALLPPAPRGRKPLPTPAAKTQPAECSNNETPTPESAQHPLRSLKALEAYFRDKNLRPSSNDKANSVNTNINHLRNLFRAAGDVEDIGDIIKKPEEFVHLIQNATKRSGEPYKLPSIVGCFQTVMLLIDGDKQLPRNTPGFPKGFLTEEQEKIYRDVFKSYQSKGSIDLLAKTTDPDLAVYRYPAYMELVKAEFGELSREYVIVSFYNEFPMRDDFKKLHLIRPDQVEGRTDNYVILPETGVGHLRMHTYNKTQAADGYNDPDDDLSLSLSNLLRAYCASDKGPKIGKGTLFGTASLSPDIGEINKRLGLDSSGMAINYLRHSKVSTVYEKRPGVDAKTHALEIAELSRRMKHEQTTANTYVRVLLPDPKPAGKPAAKNRTRKVKA